MSSAITKEQGVEFGSIEDLMRLTRDIAGTATRLRNSFTPDGLEQLRELIGEASHVVALGEARYAGSDDDFMTSVAALREYSDLATEMAVDHREQFADPDAADAIRVESEWRSQLFGAIRDRNRREELRTIAERALCAAYER
jgi:hypothetical protein